MSWFPLAGLCIGLISLGVYNLAMKLFSPEISVIIAFVVGIVITGALHIDGFADVCDAFYGGRNREEILTIMKDSRIGTMGAVGIFSLLIVKLALLIHLTISKKVTEAFLVPPVVGRWLMTVAASRYSYARKEGIAAPFINNAGLREAIIASLLALLIIFLVADLSGVIVALLTLTICWAYLEWVKRRIGGVTGDVLGSVNEISEVSTLFFLHFNIWS